MSAVDDNVGPTGQAQHAAEIGKAEHMEMRQAEQDLMGVMSTDPGKRFMFRLLSSCGVFSPNPSIGDAGVLAYNEGVRAVGAGLMNDILMMDKGNGHTVLLEMLADGFAREAAENFKKQTKGE
jgi:hypothetical protein